MEVARPSTPADGAQIDGVSANENGMPSITQFLDLNQFTCAGSAPPAIARGVSQAEQMTNSVLSFLTSGGGSNNIASGSTSSIVQQQIHVPSCGGMDDAAKSLEGGPSGNSSSFSKDGISESRDAEAEAEAEVEVDEERYSRQLYVHGHATQRKLQKSNVAIIGVSGLGAEIAKNIILAGVSSVTLCDPEPPNSYDLGGNYCLSEHDVGSTLGRAAISAPKLAELNHDTAVHVARVQDFTNQMELMSLVETGVTSCLVVTLPLPMLTVLALNDLCRARNVPFIYSLAHGVFGHVFNDFGSSFTVDDKGGEDPSMSQIEEILPSNPATVTVDARIGGHGLEDGDWVKLERVKGRDGSVIRATQEYEVEVINSYSFKLLDCDLSHCEELATQGYVRKMKRSATASFWPLRKALRRQPEEPPTDYGKYDRPALLHLAFRALAAYRDRHNNSLPVPGRKQHIKEVLQLAHALDRDGVMQTMPEDAELTVMQLASGSQAVLAPMTATVGGIVGQEVLKACSGTFMPIKGFLFFDAAECLPRKIMSETHLSPGGRSRTDSQRACFGFKAQADIENLKYFLVGCGAIGCEVLKNWALMGIGCGEEGSVMLTDPDRVERSNLCRQLLLRDQDIGKFKSVMAAAAARDINPNMNIKAKNEKICRESEAEFTDCFYGDLNGIVTALDNVAGRRYLDEKCLLHGIPLIDGGTLGTKGSTQVVVPYLTEHYSASSDPDETAIPICTVKNFPNLIPHTLQWAKETFIQHFDSDIRNAKSYLFDPDNYMKRLGKQQHTRNEKLTSLMKTLVDERPYTFTDCLVWARVRFEELYNNQIQQLLHNFPADHTNSFGSPFWAGSRRCPSPLQFDAKAVCVDAGLRNHYDFIVGAAKLRAHAYGIPPNTDESYVFSVLENVIVPPFQPQDGVNTSTEPDLIDTIGSSASYGFRDEEEYEELIQLLPRRQEVSDIKLYPTSFDKDNSLHMGFVTSASNCRALNYDIPTETIHKSKAIAGSIIPAISTTTAVVGGLMCLELYKLAGMAQRKIRAHDLRNTFLNLALPFMTMSEPAHPIKRTILLQGRHKDVTEWDLIDLRLKNATLKQMLKHFKKHLGFAVDSISVDGNFTLYNKYIPSQSRSQRLKIPVVGLYLNAAKKDALPKGTEFLQLEVTGIDVETGGDVELPRLRYYFS